MQAALILMSRAPVAGETTINLESHFKDDESVELHRAFLKDISSKFLNFYIKSIGTDAEVTLQWKRTDDASYSDLDTYTAAGKYTIQDKANDVYYRAIVKDDKQGSGGASVFGIEW